MHGHQRCDLQDVRPREGDVGHTIRYHLVATNAAGTGSIYSNLSDKVVAKGDPPKNIVLPVITGTVAPGNAVHASPGEWAGARRLLRLRVAALRQAGTNCAPITGATSPTYVVDSADSGKSLRTRVTRGTMPDRRRPTRSPSS